MEEIALQQMALGLESYNLVSLPRLKGSIKFKKVAKQF